MMKEPFETDEELALELAEALSEVAPHSREVADRAKGSFTWRTIDEDLLRAELMFDSALESATSTRGAGSGRVLVFNTELSQVEVEVLSDRVVGQFVPPSAGEVDVEGERGVVATATVDDLGLFVIEPVPPGVVRLRCTTSTTRLVTDWVRM